ncbi:hypothetical protein Glove_543g57 [Diversispora epigaea]|uniref:Uncharacterized protein n=1 Tax=Diversispora epigaea TaxID=1348612 RepID=A0A397GL39_9GLOM|nr:hypothetical protein Glove_543g57 [Diversispora epigaea]
MEKPPSDWKKRIWNQLVSYRNNNKLIDCNKRYFIAKKLEFTERFSCPMAVEVNIAICHSCDQLIYINKRTFDISFKEYMELKQKPEVEHDFFTRLAIYRYEL